MNSPVTLRLGTRGSLLARRQSDLVISSLQSLHPHLRIKTVIIKTTGDRITDRPLYEEGGKGLFVKEIEQALLERYIDIAVHSYKDLPVTMPLVDESQLIIAATPPRHDPRDLFISQTSNHINALPKAARVGTGSLRRQCQLLTKRPDLQIAPVRGNIDTRLKKLHQGEFDAIILALAGVERAGLLEPSWMNPLSIDDMLPAPGQGALALQCRFDDQTALQVLRILDDPATHTCIEAERGVVALLQGDCHSPIGALAQITNGTLHLRAMVGSRDGRPPIIHAAASSKITNPLSAVRELGATLASKGASQMLKN